MADELERYTELTTFLGQILGEDYEVVLHWRNKKNEYYIAAIEHGNISGRTINSPITNLAMDLVKNKVYLKRSFVTNYKAISDSHHELNGSTYFIKDAHQELLGLLCINFDSRDYIDMANVLLRLAKQDHILIGDDITSSEGSVAEVLSSRIENVIDAYIDPRLLEKDASLSVDKKIQIVSELDQRGIFQIKGAIARVAELLKVSEPSVYRYIKEAKKRTSL